MTTPDVPQLVDHLFRHSAGQMVATLTRVFGPHNLQLAEDVVQDVLMLALRQWPYRGVPHNPRGWLFQAARNRALDVLRREQRFDQRVHLLVAWEQAEAASASDDQLTLMLLCCHPALSRESQVALTLKTVGGFSAAEIARALLTSEPTVAQRLVRAKRTLREQPLPFALPPPAELPGRMQTLLTVLYLLFNEGYAASHGDAPIRQDLCAEAIRLTELLAEHPASAGPQVHALLALMWLHAARLDARTDPDGELLLLEEQDRGRWDRRMIGQGIAHLQRAATGSAVTVYHLQAGIAACHALAPDYAATQWDQIVGYYDALLALGPSPIVALNRAVALAMLHGPDAGLAALTGLDAALAAYPLLPAVRGTLLARAGRRSEAEQALRQALDAAQTSADRRLIARKLAALAA